MPSEELPSDVKSPIRLCRKNATITPARMRKILRDLHVALERYYVWTGHQTPTEFIAMNPTWSLRAWQVLVIENLNYLQGETLPDFPTAEEAAIDVGGMNG